MIRCIFFVIIIASCAISAIGQKFFEGEILSADTNEPLIGANVISTNAGASADINGAFQIVISSFPTHLLISYVGFEALNFQLNTASDWPEQGVFKLHPITHILNEATVTASKYDQRLAESSVSIELLKPKFIEHSGSAALDEILIKVPGVEIIGDQANIRGGSGFSYGAGSRVLLLVDDIPALQSDAGFPNWNDLPLENLSQVEIVKGASSALYGSSALNGIINIRTAYALSEPVTKAALFYGQYANPSEIKRKWWDKAPNSIGFSLSDKRKIKKLDLVSGLFLYKLDSYNQDTYENRARLNISTRYRHSDRTTFSIRANLNLTDNQDFFYWSNAVSGAYKASSGTISSSKGNRFYVDPKWTHFDKYRNRHKVQGRAYMVNNESNGNRSITSNLYYLEYQFSRNLAAKWKWSAGIVSYASYVDAELYSQDRYSSYNAASYVQLDKRYHGKLLISLGARLEYNALETPSYVLTDTAGIESNIQATWDEDVQPVFRFGLNYELDDFSFIRFSFGQGYRYPTIAEKFTSTTFGSFNVFPNRALKPETGWNSEIGFKQGYSVFGMKGYGDIALFWSEYQNMMEFLFASQHGLYGFQSRNVGNIRIKGIEVTAGGRSNFGILGINYIGGVSYINPTYIDFNESVQNSSSVDYNILKYRSKWNTKFDLELDAYSLSLGGSFRYVSQMEAIDNEFNDFIAGLKDFRRLHDHGYKVFDARMAYAFKQFKIILVTNNVLNSPYMSRPGLLEAPRNYIVRLEYVL